MALAPTVVIGGTTSAMRVEPVAEGGTVQDSNITGADLDAATQLQGPDPTRNPYQEVNLFVGEFARVFTMAPQAAIARIQAILQTMRTQFYNA